MAKKIKKPEIPDGRLKPEEEKAKVGRRTITAKGPVPPKKVQGKEFIKTGIEGLDALFTDGIPKRTSVLVAGGAGSGKTLLCLQILLNAAKSGKKCLYMSFEESAERLKSHMENFGWKLDKIPGTLMIKRFNLFDITRSIDALLAKQSGDLLIDVKPVILPDDFKPDIVVVDSLTSIASAFIGREETYRIYIEQLFRYFEEMGINSFFISETTQNPEVFSPTGVEEFLADGVIVLYNIKRGNVRESALEVLKMRGTRHQKKMVALQIIDGRGIEVYPEQEVLGVK